MQRIEQRVATFLEDEQPSGMMLAPEQVTALAIKATRFYGGYARLAVAWEELDADPDLSDPDPVIDGMTPVSDAEWALIGPLFALYVEREIAVMLEASRGLGVDVFGRSTSEIATDITLKEQEMPRAAFMVPVQTVV